MHLGFVEHPAGMACDPIVTTGSDGQPRVSYPSGCATTTVDVTPEGEDIYRDMSGKMVHPTTAGQWFQGISNSTVLIAGAVVGAAILFGRRR